MPGMGAERIRVKSFTYRKSSFGIYRRQELLDLRKINDHIAQILSDGWEILAQTAHSCERILLRPFSKPNSYFSKELKLGSSTSATGLAAAQIADQGRSSAEVTTR